MTNPIRPPRYPPEPKGAFPVDMLWVLVLGLVVMGVGLILAALWLALMVPAVPAGSGAALVPETPAVVASTASLEELSAPPAPSLPPPSPTLPPPPTDTPTEIPTETPTETAPPPPTPTATELPSPTPDGRVDTVLANMSLEDKIGQMLMPAIGSPVADPVTTSTKRSGPKSCGTLGIS